MDARATQNFIPPTSSGDNKPIHPSTDSFKDFFIIVCTFLACFHHLRHKLQDPQCDSMSVRPLPLVKMKITI